MSTVTNELPQTYQEDLEQFEISDALTRGVSDRIDFWTELLENLETYYLDPETCKVEWLDTLARWAGWGESWDSSVSELIKRKLLKNTSYIWRNRGNRDILPFLFSIYGLNATLKPQTGIILGVSTIPAYFASDPFSYLIKVPPSYTVGSPEYLLILRLLKQFAPCWVYFIIDNS
ncbi:MAG: hypothetical protein KME30_17200 [Iphinoe sp. HA4291-MV1]|jgi:hypothetical protein|nr:hypothetical protein [Iphinoe sp. HA4291-MV1]